MPRQPYNGHESWNAWNVALWISNDEALYRLAMKCIRTRNGPYRPTADQAARRFAGTVPTTERTPDGARYSHRSVELALAALMED
jgi:hypothetical protein